jgi:hypothetical protein
MPVSVIYREVIRPFLILRKIKIESNPLDFFSSNEHDYEYRDYEYQEDAEKYAEDGEVYVDGYEINIFDTKKQSIRSMDTYFPEYEVSKKFLDVYFMGNRNPGDIGIFVDKYNIGHVESKFFFTTDIHDQYFPIIKNYYENQSHYTLDYEESRKRILNLLLVSNRDKRINKLI